MLERSYAGMGLRDLAAAIGLQVASLYNHIENKQELLFSILYDHMLQALAGVDAALKDVVDDPEQQLRTFVVFHITFHTSRPVEAGVCLSELRSLEGKGRKTVLALRDSYQARLAALIQNGIEKAVFRVEDPHLATLLILGAITGVLTWYDPEAGIPADAIAERYADLLLGGLRRRPRGRS